MRILLLACGVVSVLACRDSAPTVGSLDPSVADVPAGPTDRVVVEMARRDPSSGEFETRTTELEVRHLPDGVLVTRSEPFTLSPLRGRGPDPSERIPLGASLLRVSSGYEPIGPDGAALELPDLLADRRSAGFPERSRELTAPGPRDARGRPIGRRTEDDRPRGNMIVDSARAAENLRLLRARGTLAEERIAPDRIRFTSTAGAENQIWTFDETIGTVVEMRVERGGKPYVTVAHTYAREHSEWRRQRTEFVWYDSNGDEARRATHVIERIH